MNDERWTIVDRLLGAALEREPHERAAYLREACGDDEALRRDVESLIAHAASGAGVVSTPAVVLADGIRSAGTSMVGRRVGPYLIGARLGAGGMGEVYRARDSKLGRDVAIKILPRIFTTDPDRRSRLDREARVLAALNHPHIGAIYGLEEMDATPALVLELVEGDTLAERLAKGPLKITDALTIAHQIADALDAAHEKGIVHRDLKPANIKITPEGVVKVLDFGLAKAASGDASGPDLTQSPTVTIGGTHDGVILGTAPYMSPEQARGKAIDKRTDVWAFGCVVYQMLTGRVAFAGDTLSDTIAAILDREPEWGALPRLTPATLRRLLQRCLEKDAERRLHDIADARIEIEDAERGTLAEGPAAAGPSRRRERLILVSALALVSAIAVVFIARLVSPSAESRPDIATPPTDNPVSFAVSPDGEKIVYTATSKGGSQLWLRSLALDWASARPLLRTNDGAYPFWSPDSRSVGFFAKGQLKRIDLDSGSVENLADHAYSLGGAWNPDGVILFNSLTAGPIVGVSAKGARRWEVTKLEPQQSGHRFPQFLPDFRHFLYYAAGAPESRGVYVGDLEGSKPQRLFDADSGAVYTSSGQLLFASQGALLARNFDATGLTVGTPWRIADHLAVNGLAIPALSASAVGPIAYRRGSAVARRRLRSVDRSGTEGAPVGDADLALPFLLSISRDGRRLAMQRNVDGNADIWWLDIANGVRQRLTDNPLIEAAPVWSPDHGSVVYGLSDGKGGYDLYTKSLADDAKEEQVLATTEFNSPTDWSRDWLVYVRDNTKTGLDIFALRWSDKKRFPVVDTNANEKNGQLSPNQDWIAYESDRSGQPAIYVQPFPRAGKRELVGVGSQVRLGRDGTELFYVTDGNLMAVSIQFSPTDQAFTRGTPHRLFPTPVGFIEYAVSRDGQRFLMNVAIDDEVDETFAPITVIFNWKAKP